MQFKMIHENYNVADLAVSIPFYEEALGLHEVRRKEAQDGSFIIVYLANDASDFELELTWLRDMDRPYNLGDCEFHATYKIISNDMPVCEYADGQFFCANNDNI